MFFMVYIIFRKLGKDVELKEFKLMCHGFLSFNLPMSGLAKESKEGIKIGTNWLKEMLSDDVEEKVNGDPLLIAK